MNGVRSATKTGWIWSPSSATVLVVGLFVLAGGTAVVAQVTWTVDHFAHATEFGAVAMDPRGEGAIVERQVADPKTDERPTSLVWLRPGHPRYVPWVNEAWEPSQPRFSPAGETLAFLGKPKAPDDEDSHSQVCLLSRDGKVPTVASEFPEGVVSFRWIDEATILAVAPEALSAAAVEREKRKDGAVVFEDDAEFRERATRLFVLRRGGDESGVWEAERIDSHDEHVEEMEPSPDGQWVVARRQRSPHFTADERVPPRIVLRSLADRGAKEREIFSEEVGKPTTFRWTNDSTAFYAFLPRSEHPGELTAAQLELVQYTVATNQWERIPVEAPAGLLPESLGVDAAGFWALRREGARNGLVRYENATGSTTRFSLPTAGHIPFELHRSAGPSSALLVSGNASTPDRWSFVGLEESGPDGAKPTAAPFEIDEALTPARAEVVRYLGANSTEIEAILHWPTSYEEGRRFPLVLMPHGGPYGRSLDRFEDDWSGAPNLLAARGAFVLQPNYHGSEGYGREFGESIRGRYFELELVDLLAGIRSLDERGLVDPEKLAVSGWSNGAILAIALQTLAAEFAPSYQYRFQACVPGAGDVNWTSDYGTCEFGPAFDNYYLGAAPWARPDIYLRKSALFFAERVTTPTLILFGEDDLAVPTAQGYEWHRALQQIGKAPVRLVVFPKEGHSLDRPSSRRRKLEEELAWLDRWLFRSADAQSLVSEDSPLAAAEARRTYARSGDRWGVLEGDVLVPELVDVGWARVGRFEVTRAQWQTLFPETRIEKGHENYPVVGLSEAEALQYLERLKAKTGRPFRFLTVEEWDQLPRSNHEVTLDGWAGRILGFSERREFRRAAVDTWGDTSVLPLLEPVGSLAPALVMVGKLTSRLHDLGGNAGEWVEKDGALVARGPCAFQSPDPQDLEAPPRAYVGLRIATER